MLDVNRSAPIAAVVVMLGVVGGEFLLERTTLAPAVAGDFTFWPRGNTCRWDGGIDADAGPSPGAGISARRGRNICAITRACPDSLLGIRSAAPLPQIHLAGSPFEVSRASTLAVAGRGLAPSWRYWAANGCRCAGIVALGCADERADAVGSTPEHKEG